MNIKTALIATVTAAMGSLGLVAADLTVTKGAPQTITTKVNYDHAYLHDNLTVDGTDAVLTLANNVDGDVTLVAQNAGDNVTITLKNGGRMVQNAGQGGYLKIGGNGAAGSGGFGRLRAEGKGNGQDTFRSRYFVVDTGATVPTTGSDNLVLYLGSDASGRVMFATRGVQNWNKNPIRVQFAGGYMSSTDGGGAAWFYNDPAHYAGTVIVESVNNNPIEFMNSGHKDKPLFNARGKLVFTGNGDLITDPASSVATGDTPFMHTTEISGNATNYDWSAFGGNIMVRRGRLLVTGVNVLPCNAKSGIIGSLDAKSYIDFQKDNEVNGINCLGIVTNSASAAGVTVTLGKYKNGFVKAVEVTPNVHLKQVGNQITVPMEYLSNYELAGGTLLITNDIVFGKLTLAAGATLRIDGCEVRVNPSGFSDAGANIECVNGGELLFDVPEDMGMHIDRLPSCGYVKVGDGTIVMNQRKAFESGDLVVREGTVRLSGYGIGNEWWRVKVMKARGGWYPFLSCIGLFADEGHVPVTETNTYTYLNTKTTTTLKRGEVAFYADTAEVVGNIRYETPNGNDAPGNPKTMYYKDVSYLLKSAADQACCFARYTVNATTGAGSWSGLDKSCPAVITFRRAEGDNVPVVGFSIRQPWNSSNAAHTNRYTSAWTVETSTDGTSWTVVQDRGTTEESLGKYGLDPWGRWFGGNGVTSEVTDKTNPDFEKCLAPLPLENIPVGNLVKAKGMNEAVNVQVDSGATLDCTLVDGKQAIGSLTVDVTNGGGTLKGVILAETGVLRLVNTPDGFRPTKYQVPVSFVDSVTGTPLTGWRVELNGRPIPNHLGWRNGQLEVLPVGVTIISR